jgi:hypothetical protein
LLPFAEREIQERAKCIAAGTPPLATMTQLANATLSDCLQLVDDAVRSIVESGEEAAHESISSPEAVVLKQAVHESTGRFISWLASAFEVLAGGESSDPLRTIDAGEGEVREASELSPSRHELDDSRVSAAFDDSGDVSANDGSIAAQIDGAYRDILQAGGQDVDVVHSDFIWSIIEICRLAQGSIADVLDQSMTIQFGGHKKKPKSLFKEGKRISSEYPAIVHRFQLTSSRLLVLYASNRGSNVAKLFVEGLTGFAANEDDVSIPFAPRDAVLDGLEVIRETATECAKVFGEAAWVRPMPVVNRDVYASTARTAAMSRKTGLQLDVERMFKEKLAVYHHPSEVIDHDSIAIVFLVFKIAFRSLLESVRTLELTGAQYLQLQMDVDFLKIMVPHYIPADYSAGGSYAGTSLSNLLADVIEAAGDRCLDEECVDNSEVKQSSTELLATFLSDKENNGVSERLLVVV